MVGGAHPSSQFLRFIHTSDWHLGKTYRRLGPQSTKAHEWRFMAIRRIFELATARQVAFILVAGDVFDSDSPSREVLEQAGALLADAPVPVVMIPGNHDPAAEGSIWTQEALVDRLRGLPTLRLALGAEPIEFPEANCVVFPCPVTRRISPEDVSASMPAGQRGTRFRIGLAHGRWQGYQPGIEYADNFIAANRAEKAGLDYLALGDFHSYTLADHPAASARTYYSGTPECTVVDEERSGFALLVEIDRPGDTPRVEPIRVGKLRPVRLPKRIVSPGDLPGLQAEVDRLVDPADCYLGLEIEGSFTVDEWQAFQAWRNALTERFLAVELLGEHLVAEPSETDFAALDLDVAESAMLQLLRDPQQLAARLTELETPVLLSLAAKPETRREAVMLFYRLLRESAGP